MDHSVQRIEIPPLSSTSVQDTTHSHTPPYRHSTESYHIDQGDDALYRWREIEANASKQSRHAIAKQRGGDTNTSNYDGQTFDYSSRSNSRDYNDDIEDRPITTASTKQPPHTHRISCLPAAVIVSPNYDDDEILPSSISSRLSFEPWERSVQPPPFVHDSHMSENVYNYTAAPTTTNRRYNDYSENHVPLYDSHSHRPYDQYNHYIERDVPSQGYRDVSSHHQQRYSVESDNDFSPPPTTSTVSWNHGSVPHDTVAPPPPPRRMGSVLAEPKMIEITPGNMSRLRDAQETITAIQNDFYVPCTCIFCSITSPSSSPYGDNTNSREPIFCIQDAEYFMCPRCASINRLDAVDHGNNDSTYSNNRSGAFHMLGGVGLGFTVKTLLEVQRDFITKRQA